jgi:glycerophosphoryl diester phosphodiesterase
MRIANHPAQISETDFESLQNVIKKQHSNDTLRQHRLYTLDEFLESSRNKIKLMIELKKPGTDLIRNVITAIRQRSMKNEVAIMSMNLDAVRSVNKIAPEITVGYVSAFSLGNISQLPVDFLAINHRSATNQLITNAHQQDLDIYVWTVNRPDIMTTMIERNVDGIVTDNPKLGIKVRNEIQELTMAERLLLQFHQLAR